MTKVRLVKAMVFPVVMFGCESWTIKKAEWWRIDGCELWCWRRLLRVPWTARKSNQSTLKEPWIFTGRTDAETPILWPPDAKTHWKRPGCWERLRAGGEGGDKDEMVGWLNGHEFEQTWGDSEGQGILVCLNSWGHKKSTWQNNSKGLEGKSLCSELHEWQQRWRQQEQETMPFKC